LLLAGSGIVTLATRGFAETPGAEIFYVLAMLAASLSALAERTSALRAWNAVGASTLLAAGAVLATGTDGLPDALVYLAGTVPAWATGWAALRRLDRSEGRALTWYHGLTASRPLASTTFFFAAIALSGFPISPAFVGEDLLLHHAMGHHHWLAAGLTVSFVANGIALLRLYVRLCLGPRERRFEASASTGRSPGGRIPGEYINSTVISIR
jgi:NADH:ubiquinone oxidoreductase subunit 2 (subunit N)